MQDSEHVSGLSELQKFLDQLAPNIEANIMRGALRAGMNVVKPIAAGAVHSVSGQLEKGLKITTRNRGGAVTSSLKATGPHAHIAHLVEYGTKAHSIEVKFNGWLAFMNQFRKVVAHPGSKPKPFMRPALDSQASAAVSATAQYIKNRLETEQGFNTKHINVEGDE